MGEKERVRGQRAFAGRSKGVTRLGYLTTGTQALAQSFSLLGTSGLSFRSHYSWAW
jgi:hypothetical protein